MWQMILTIIFYIWLFAVLLLLWLIWRGSAKHMQRLQQTLVEVAMKSAEAAQKAAEAAFRLAEKLGGHPQP